MSGDDRKFCRIYYDQFKDEYPAVWSDDRLFATYVRLLAIADAMWPSIPEIPRSERAASVSALISAGLVIPVGEYGYRIRGLDSDRTKRRNAGRTGAAKRWHSDGISDRNAEPDANASAKASAIGDAEPMHARDQTNPSQTSQLPPPPAERGRRKDGTNPRETGDAPRQQATNLRALGESPRQEREAQKRGPVHLSAAVLDVIRGGA